VTRETVKIIRETHKKFSTHPEFTAGPASSRRVYGTLFNQLNGFCKCPWGLFRRSETRMPLRIARHAAVSAENFGPLLDLQSRLRTQNPEYF
jgi:hypothetical protein